MTEEDKVQCRALIELMWPNGRADRHQMGAENVQRITRYYESVYGKLKCNCSNKVEKMKKALCQLLK